MYVTVPAEMVDSRVVGLALVPPYTLYDARSLSLLADQERVMLVFPAALQHAVYPFYTSDDYRISVSGNVRLKDLDNMEGS